MITDNIIELVNTIKTQHLANLKLKQRIANEETDKVHIRNSLARAALVCLKEKLNLVYRDTHQLSKLGLTISQRHNSDDPDGVYHFNGNIYGTHHHYIDINHNYNAGAIRIYTSCEPNFRVFYGVEIYSRGSEDKYLDGILDSLCRSVEEQKLSLVTNSEIIIESHATVIGKLLAESEM